MNKFMSKLAAKHALDSENAFADCLKSNANGKGEKGKKRRGRDEDKEEDLEQSIAASLTSMSQLSTLENICLLKKDLRDVKDRALECENKAEEAKDEGNDNEAQRHKKRQEEPFPFPFFSVPFGSAKRNTELEEN